MKFVLILLVLLFGLGCNNVKVDCDGTYTYQPGDWTSAEQASLTRAVAIWNEYTGREVLRLAIGGKTDDECHIQPAYQTLEHDANGEYEYGPGRVQIMSGFGTHTNIWVHEFGHGLGLQHTENIHSYMYSFAGDAFTSETEEECQRVGVCL